MIVDKLENAELYADVHPGFLKVVEWMRTVANPDMPVGRYDIEGCEGLCYVFKLDKKSRPYHETFMDKHSKFIDFHLLLEGEEILGWETIAKDDEPVGALPEDDIVLYKDRNSNSLRLEKGDIYLVWPHEGHKSACHIDSPYVAKKIVGKLLLKQD